MAKENEYAPNTPETNRLPERTVHIEGISKGLRKHGDNDIQKSKLYKQAAATDQKKASRIRAKILRISYERYNDKTMRDNPSRLAAADRELMRLILKKNSLIPNR